MGGTSARCSLIAASSATGRAEKSRAEGLRLDVRDGALAARKAGSPIVPGKPDESLLIKRILTDDPDDIMPPPSAAAQEAALRGREGDAATLDRRGCGV